MSTSAQPPRTRLTERQWQDQVLQLARQYRWSLTYHPLVSQGSAAGWPDLVLAHPGRQRVVFLELKTDTGHIRPEQVDWLEALDAAGLEATLLRPRDLPVLIDILGPANCRAVLPPEIEAWKYFPRRMAMGMRT
jgi:hypothetical protein